MHLLYSFLNYVAMPVLHLSFSMALHYSGILSRLFRGKAKSFAISPLHMLSAADTPQDRRLYFGSPIYM